MSTITTGMASQYADSTKLAARARIHHFAHAEIPWFRWIAQQIPLAPDAKVLDVGCGPAWFWPDAVEIMPPGLDLTLLDQSRGMVDEALERCRPLPFARVEGMVADATDLPVPDGAFDAVIAMHMLYHVADQEKALAEFHRVLKPGGVLAVTTNGFEDMRELYSLTTVFGSAPVNPSAIAFGFERADELMRRQFGNATLAVHPATMRVTDPEVVIAALTSYPPGDSAPPEQQSAFRRAIGEAFAAGNGGIDVTKQAGLLISRKSEV